MPPRQVSQDSPQRGVFFCSIGSVQTNTMPVNHEIKSQLAKLLATEDLVVEHKKVSTACFNVHTRVLTLPMWDRASNIVYDMLVGHEVGHALYTSYDDWKKDSSDNPKWMRAVFHNVEESMIDTREMMDQEGINEFRAFLKHIETKGWINLDKEDDERSN